MAKELFDIITRAAEVRDATLSAENTAERVSGVLCDLLEYIATLIAAGDVQVVADMDGTGLKVTFRKLQKTGIFRTKFFGDDFYARFLSSKTGGRG